MCISRVSKSDLWNKTLDIPVQVQVRLVKSILEIVMKGRCLNIFFSFLNFFYTEPILFLEINPEYGLPLCAGWFIINDHTNSLLQVSDTYPGAAIL